MSYYTEKFKDPRWQKKRLKILKRDNFCCQLCFEDKSLLHVHHNFYDWDEYPEPWDYPEESLVTLCEDCHTEEHKLWAGANINLINIIRSKGITAHYLWRLGSAFAESKFNFRWDVAIDVFCDFIKSKKKMDAMIKKYMDSLGKKKK